MNKPEPKSVFKCCAVTTLYVFKWTTAAVQRLYYHFCLITEVKQSWARIVLEWATCVLLDYVTIYSMLLDTCVPECPISCIMWKCCIGKCHRIVTSLMYGTCLGTWNNIYEAVKEIRRGQQMYFTFACLSVACVILIVTYVRACFTHATVMFLREMNIMQPRFDALIFCFCQMFRSRKRSYYRFFWRADVLRQ